MSATLTRAERKRAQELIDKGIPERFEGMPDEDAVLVLRFQGHSEMTARFELDFFRGRINEDGTRDLGNRLGEDEEDQNLAR